MEENTIDDQEIKKEIETIKNLIDEDSDSIRSGNDKNKVSDRIADFPLVVNQLSKIYENSNPSEVEKLVRKKALNNFSILLKKNEIFGLLG